MVKTPVLRFAEFIFDAQNGCLYAGGTRIALSPKDSALLHHLATHAGSIVPHGALLRAGWGETAVGPDVLKVRVARIRRLLGDDAATPRFIANVHGEGYRFLPRCEVIDELEAVSSNESAAPVVGRDRELQLFDQALRDAAAGRRRMVFVTGDAGMGKTTLIDCCVDRVGARGWVGRGQCIEHYGRGEPYLPVMEALSRLAREANRSRLRTVLEQYAPSWLVQLPALLDPADRQALQRRVGDPNRERMLRELAEALEALGAAQGEQPVVVLVFEDLHWADVSTLDLLQMLGRRRERARILVVGSYRPFESTGTSASLRNVVQDLCRQGAAAEHALGLLESADVRRYLTERFHPNAFPTALAEAIQLRTAGHPLFLNEILRDLTARSVIVRGDLEWTFHGDAGAVNALMPASVEQLLTRQRDALDFEDRRLMEAASIAGVEFAAAAVAAALQSDPAEIEERCLRLARGQRFLRVAGSEEWPDATQSMRFAFPHVLHWELWQQDVAGRRAEEWHLRIAEREEAAYGGRAAEIAPVLAERFELGRDYERAIAYREHAAALATQRAANAEAKGHLTHAIGMLDRLPDAPARMRLELRLRIGVGTVSALGEGFASDGASQSFERAYEIYRQNRDAPEMLDSVFGLCRSFWVRGELARARELSDHMQLLVRRGADPVRTLGAHLAHGTVLATQGEFEAAAAVLIEGLELARAHWHDGLVGIYASDVEITCASTIANTLQIAGHPDRAAGYLDEAIRLGNERPHPVSAACAFYGAALFYQVRGDAGAALEYAERLAHVASGHNLAQYMLYGNMHRGWALVANNRSEEGLALLRAAVDVVRGSGAALLLPQALGLLADAYRSIGCRSEARSAIDEALGAAARNGADMHDAELHRLDAELLAASPDGGAGAAEASFRRAITIARHQHARLWELRAALGLGRLWRDQGRSRDSHALVSEVCGAFTEGFETPDLQAARAFLS